MTDKKTPDGRIETTLGEVVEITSSKRIFANEYQTLGIPFFRGKEVTEKFNGSEISTELFITEEKYNEIKTNFGVPEENDILLTSVGTLGNPYLVEKDFKFYFKDGNLTWFRRYKGINPKWLYYWIISSQGKETLSHAQIGSTQQAYTIVSLKKLSISLPSLSEQQSIAAILSSFDDKIELLREQNKTLEQIGQTIFQEWFGKYTVDAPEELPEGWRVGRLGEIAENLDAQRIPIASDKREIGEYPYYGATGINGYVKNYIFDGVYTLLGEDGSVIKENGRPFTQYVWGKIWVNNHAHVLQGKNGFSTEMIKIILDNTDIAPFVNGAVQLKINQTNMNVIPAIISDQETLEKFDEAIQQIFAKIRYNTEQIQSLVRSRNELLPRLMSSEIRMF